MIDYADLLSKICCSQVDAFDEYLQFQQQQQQKKKQQVQRPSFRPAQKQNQTRKHAYRDVHIEHLKTHNAKRARNCKGKRTRKSNSIGTDTESNTENKTSTQKHITHTTYTN